jgi:hypothetical protein
LKQRMHALPRRDCTLICLGEAILTMELPERHATPRAFNFKFKLNVAAGSHHYEHTEQLASGHASHARDAVALQGT